MLRCATDVAPSPGRGDPCATQYNDNAPARLWRHDGGVPHALVIALALLAVCGGLAAAQMPPPSSEESPSDQESESEPDYNGEDLTRPQSSIQLRLQERTSDSNSADRTTMYLRVERARNFAFHWNFDWFAQLPVVWKSTGPDEPDDSTRRFGIGNAVLESRLGEKIDDRWAYGFGLRLTVPTARDWVGTGQWQMAPILGLRYLFLESGTNTYFAPKIRYAIGLDEGQSRHVSEPQIAPTLGLDLPDRWFIVFYPSYDIRFNFGTPVSGQTGRLFLPFDASIGRKLTDALQLSFEVGVPIIANYPVYKLKTELKLAAKF